MAAEAETRIQVATVQAVVKRIIMSDQPPPIDQFDCIIIDEAHRGYTLDQEMTKGELATRDASQYISSYRRVLDYFDAVKIALTATPAKHTSDIFGKSVYTYSYREAVADDWLIDHEPPIRYETLLTQNGIRFEKGKPVDVINENFNRVICEQLVQELDPFGDEKTLIFCATDLHADMVKRLLDDAFKDLYNGDYHQAAVAKITGKSDKVDLLIRRYKNERYPSIAITVDLLTTGIDVPTICNLVFMRRVRSRILYEQMVGRATRRCDDIGKTVFRIYDPVDIYAALQDVNTMKPLVKNPDITLEQLAEELTDPQKLEAALHSPGEQQGETQADVVLSQLSQKLVRVLRKANKKAENRERNQTYGTHKRPEDYLDEFSRFISEQLNQSAALSVVVNKPRDLTRQQLREVKLLLDNHGYSEAHLQSAVRKQTNKDIAASIIGHIRRAALGEALIPFEQRVATAMGNIYTRHSWTPAQRKWLDRLAKQLVHEVIIDRDFVNNRFAEDGGAKRMEKVLGDQLDVVLEELNDAMWPLQSA